MPEERPPDRVLIVCTANRCRSVMARALLGQQLRRRGAAVRVRSAGTAGTAGSGLEPPAEVVSVMAGYGLDVGAHRSHRVTTADLETASLVLAMAREHVRHAAVTVPGSWPRAFTLKEIVRRGTQYRARMPGESLAAWLAALHDGRERHALLGDCPADDVADPIGGPPGAYAGTAAELGRLAGELAGLCWAGAAAPPGGRAPGGPGQAV